MAEFVMKKMVKEAGIEKNFEIASAATSTEELGNSVYPPARRILNAHGIDCSGKTARQITKSDYEYYDLLIGMDNANMRNMKRFFGGDPAGKMSMLMDHTATPGEVADPWYSGNFEDTWQDVNAGCSGLLAELSE